MAGANAGHHPATSNQTGWLAGRCNNGAGTDTSASTDPETALSNNGLAPASGHERSSSRFNFAAVERLVRAAKPASDARGTNLCSCGVNGRT